MRIVGQEQIAAAFGVAPKTIVEWQERGFPIAVQGSRGIPNEYILPDCINWRVQDQVSKVKPEDQRERLARLQGDKVAMEIAEQQKLLIPAAAVEPKWRAACAAAREQLLRERRRAVAALNKAKTPKERDQVLAAVHDRFLRTLADWRGAGDEDLAS